MLSSSIAVKGAEFNEQQDKLILKSDKQQLQQVIANLANNALKYTRRGSVQINATYIPAVARQRVARHRSLVSIISNVLGFETSDSDSDENEELMQTKNEQNIQKLFKSTTEPKVVI